MSDRLPADERGPVRCLNIPAGPDSVHIVASVTGLTVVEVSMMLEPHLLRGTE